MLSSYYEGEEGRRVVFFTAFLHTLDRRRGVRPLQAEERVSEEVQEIFQTLCFAVGSAERFPGLREGVEDLLKLGKFRGVFL